MSQQTALSHVQLYTAHTDPASSLLLLLPSMQSHHMSSQYPLLCPVSTVHVLPILGHPCIDSMIAKQPALLQTLICPLMCPLNCPLNCPLMCPVK